MILELTRLCGFGPQGVKTEDWKITFRQKRSDVILCNVSSCDVKGNVRFGKLVEVKEVIHNKTLLGKSILL